MEQQMLFHTNLRNIGLFITLTFGCLTYHNSFPKDKLSNIIMLLSVIFLSISFILNFNVIKDKKLIKKYEIIPKLLLIIQITVLLYILNILMN